MPQEKKGRAAGFFAGLFRESALGEHIVLYGERRVSVEGCRRILQYAPQKIRLRLKNRDLLITGEHLFCESFSGSRTTVSGRIAALSFEETEERI